MRKFRKPGSERQDQSTSFLAKILVTNNLSLSFFVSRNFLFFVRSDDSFQYATKKVDVSSMFFFT